MVVVKATKHPSPGFHDSCRPTRTTHDRNIWVMRNPSCGWQRRLRWPKSRKHLNQTDEPSLAPSAVPRPSPSDMHRARDRRCQTMLPNMRLTSFCPRRFLKDPIPCRHIPAHPDSNPSNVRPKPYPAQLFHRGWTTKLEHPPESIS